jgi:hypothetical protein
MEETEGFGGHLFAFIISYAAGKVNIPVKTFGGVG